MATRAISLRKEQFDRDVASYRGDDPLKLRYEFLLWLDNNFGKEKVLDVFTSTLEEALNTHWNDVRYKEDPRLVELQMIYASLQPNPLPVYKRYYDQGVAQQSSVLYERWANHMAATGDYEGADKVFKLGLEKASLATKAELNKAFEKFLAIVGRKFLDGEMKGGKEDPCPKCCGLQSATSGISPPTDGVVAIEMNPGKAGCYEDFQTAVAMFEPPDAKYIRMYPKDKVYKDPGKEYSLEEIKAELYFERRKRMEMEAQMKKQRTSKNTILHFDAPFEAEPVVNEGVFPTPLLPSSGKEDSISAQSFTTRTKMAMNLVQDMWSSPTPVPVAEPSVLVKNEERENKTKTPFPIYVDGNPETPKAAEKKPVVPFQVFSDSPDGVPKNPLSLGKIGTAGKQKGLQPKVLSERKVKNGEMVEEPKPSSKQQLHFENEDDMLAKKLSEASVGSPPMPFQPFGGIKPLFPSEPGKDDFSDVTCNTKAFNFALPSSTPVQQRKSLAPYHSNQQSTGSFVNNDDRPSYQTQQNLSVILEASKERCSSSGSSTGSSQPRTPAFPTKKPLIDGQISKNDISRLPGSVLPGTINGGSSYKKLSFSLANKLKTKIDAFSKTPKHTPLSDLDSSFTCSFLKIRLSGEKLAALRSLKENYFSDHSQTRSFKSPANLSQSLSSSDPTPSSTCRTAKDSSITEFLKTSIFSSGSHRANLDARKMFTLPRPEERLRKKELPNGLTPIPLYHDTDCGNGFTSFDVPCNVTLTKCGILEPRQEQPKSLVISSTESGIPVATQNDITFTASSTVVKSNVKNKRGRPRKKISTTQMRTRSTKLLSWQDDEDSPLTLYNHRGKTSQRKDTKIETKQNFRPESLRGMNVNDSVHPSCVESRKRKSSTATRVVNRRKKRGSPSTINTKTKKPKRSRISKPLPSQQTSARAKVVTSRSQDSHSSQSVVDVQNNMLNCYKTPVCREITRTRSLIRSCTLKKLSSLPSTESAATVEEQLRCSSVRSTSISSRVSAVEPLTVMILRSASRCSRPDNNLNNSCMTSRAVGMNASSFKSDTLIRDNSFHCMSCDYSGTDRLAEKRRPTRRDANCLGRRKNAPKQLILEDCNDIDPFCPMINDKLLSLLNFPQPHHVDGYQVVNSNLPAVQKNVRLGNEVFTTFGDLGKGAYARVVKASTDNCTVALKIEKPACKWEYYIAKEIQRRVDPKTRSAFMDIKTAYIFSNGSILMTEWAKYGSLLNIINQYKVNTGKVLEPVLSLHFCIEMVKALEYLHKCKIIHGDIKPDNFVVKSLPSVNETEPCLMLIDFGRSIDMSMFPEGTKFHRIVTTEGFQCNEMKDQKPWNYQTDLYGLAGCIYCLLVGDYMKVVKKNEEWKLHKVLPRNLKREMWDPIFNQLLNVPSCDQLPNLADIRKILEAAFNDFNNYVKLQYFGHLSNIILGK